MSSDSGTVVDAAFQRYTAPGPIRLVSPHEACRSSDSGEFLYGVDSKKAITISGGNVHGC
jgi:hypothetical protein